MIPTVKEITEQNAFAVALARVMKERGVRVRDLAATTRLHPQTVSNIRRGLSVPKPQSVALIASALDAPELLAIGNRPRRRYCEVCKQRFTTTSTNPNRRRFCSRRCQQTAHARRRAMGRATVERAARNKLTSALAAVAAFCGRCEWDGICKDAACELRDFSPLPLITVTRRRAA